MCIFKLSKQQKTSSVFISSILSYLSLKSGDLSSHPELHPLHCYLSIFPVLPKVEFHLPAVPLPYLQASQMCFCLFLTVPVLLLSCDVNSHSLIMLLNHLNSLVLRGEFEPFLSSSSHLPCIGSTSYFSLTIKNTMSRY